MGQHVLIAIPCHTGDVRNETVKSVLEGISGLKGFGIEYDVQFLNGCSMIPEARDILAGVFLSGKWTDIVWLDGDVSFPWQDLIKLVSHPVDFVAGVYRYKRDIEEYPVSWLPGDLWAFDPVTGEPSETGLLEVEYVPMGFCRMTRSVLERMREYRKDFWFSQPMFPDLTFHGMFDREVYNGRSWGEDFVFCRRWREIGGKVLIDPSLRLTHTGTKSFSGCVGDWLRNRDKEPTAEQLAEKLRIAREQFSSPEFQLIMRQATGEAA